MTNHHTDATRRLVAISASAVEQRRQARLLAGAGVRGEQKFTRYLAERRAVEARYRESLLRW